MLSQATPQHISTPSRPRKLKLSERLPLSWRPYAQLARLDMLPAALLLFWPCSWALTAVAIKTHMPINQYVFDLLRFMAWSVLCHSSACGWDDICDRKLDAQVERTKKRPLAAGTISVRNALIFTYTQAFMTLLLLWGLNRQTLVLHVLSAVFLSAPYPYMKRLTNWPQAFLGLAINCGLLLAWTSADWPDWKLILPLYTAAWSWTVYYDTCYAMMDRKDDIKAGNKSTAVIFGDGPRARMILSLFATVTITSLLLFGVQTQQCVSYFVLTVLGTALHLAWQISTIDFHDISSCMRRFLSNGSQVGGIIWSGLLVNYLLLLRA